MLKALFSLAVIFGVSSSQACLLAKPNYSYELSGNISLQENGQKYTSCVVRAGYLTLKNGESFRVQGLVIECNERMLGHNSLYFQLKDGQVNPAQAGFTGSYDMFNLFVNYSSTDSDGTYDETSLLEFSKTCDTVSLDIDIKKSGKVNYVGKISGVLGAKMSRVARKQKR